MSEEKKPSDRVMALARLGRVVELSPEISITRYFNAGLVMIEMAKSYVKEGKLELAFILYIKFLTLSLEKLQLHDDFDCLSVEQSAIIGHLVREAMPATEGLKKQLLDKYAKGIKFVAAQSKQTPKAKKAITSKSKKTKK
ncbi:unnamed protein product [Timema podura]|uniref:USP8 dimerisation domain-containing protein n=1 Tax=Timema podura TaxID=61482 RepID=A0ABN7NT80_TIMPD|nr:unnamed protein product [Timema podura]